MREKGRGTLVLGVQRKGKQILPGRMEQPIYHRSQKRDTQDAKANRL